MQELNICDLQTYDVNCNPVFSGFSQNTLASLGIILFNTCFALHPHFVNSVFLNAIFLKF